MPKNQEPDLVTGFEAGDISAYGTVSGTGSVQSTVKRTGDWAYRSNPTAGFGSLSMARAPGTTAFGRFYIRFATLPNADIWLASYASTIGSPAAWAGISFNNTTNCLRGFAYESSESPTDVYGDDGLEVVVDTWYCVDVNIDADSGSGVTVQFQVDEDPQPTFVADPIYVANTHRRIVVGASGLNASTCDIFYDDMCFIGAPTGASYFPEYPIGPGKTVALRPDGEGTHTNASNFTDNDGTPPTNAHLKLDDDPIEAAPTNTDWVKQTAGGLFALTLEDMPAEAERINGLTVFGGGARESAGSEDASLSAYFSDIAHYWGGDDLPGSGASTAKVWFYTGVGVSTNTPADEVTVANCDALEIHITASDFSPAVRWGDCRVEVDYTFSGEPDPGGPEARQFPKIAAKWTVVPHRLV